MYVKYPVSTMGWSVAMKKKHQGMFRLCQTQFVLDMATLFLPQRSPMVPVLSFLEWTLIYKQSENIIDLDLHYFQNRIYLGL